MIIINYDNNNNNNNNNNNHFKFEKEKYPIQKKNWKGEIVNTLQYILLFLCKYEFI